MIQNDFYNERNMWPNSVILIQGIVWTFVQEDCLYTTGVHHCLLQIQVIILVNCCKVTKPVVVLSQFFKHIFLKMQMTCLALISLSRWWALCRVKRSSNTQFRIYSRSMKSGIQAHILPSTKKSLNDLSFLAILFCIQNHFFNTF